MTGKLNILSSNLLPPPPRQYQNDADYVCYDICVAFHIHEDKI